MRKCPFTPARPNLRYPRIARKTRLSATLVALLAAHLGLLGCAGPTVPTEPAVAVEMMSAEESAKLPAVKSIAPAAATTKPAAKTKALSPTKRRAKLLAGPKVVKQRAPDRFVVAFDTSKGPFRVAITRSWAPHGVDRFYALVSAGYYQDIALFRVISGFMCQFGVHGTPAIASVWQAAGIPDDPVNPAVASNQRGMLTFAKAGPNTRSTQLFINLGNNARLDAMGFPPIGRVIGGGMGVVDRLYSGYGEGAPAGRGPEQARVQQEGNTYLRRSFPKMDYVHSIAVVR